MAKSHYFVAPAPKEDGLIECQECGLPFKPKQYNSKYCSKECYRNATKKIKAAWYQEHKDEVDERRRKRFRERGMRPIEEYLRHQKSRKGRNRVIKQELIYLELQTKQIRGIKRQMEKLKWRDARHGYNEAKVDLVKSELAKLELYPEQIESSDRYKIDWDNEYRGGWL